MDSPLLHRRRLPNADEINAAILARYRQLGEDRILRRTHHFHGRFENTYVALEQIPELHPVVDLVLASAREILPDAGELRYGFWFNEMGPGHVTSLHDHDEEDELLSACYYIRVPERSGCFIAVEDGEQRFLQPEEGLLILFPPQLPHAVEENQSGETRLSVAFNIGPAEPEA